MSVNKGKKEANVEETEAESLKSETPEQVDEVGLLVQIESLSSKVQELEQQLKEEEIRGVANIQNIQRRHKTEIEDAHKYAATKFAKEILPIRDYLEMALKDQSGNFEAMKMGVELTLKHLDTAFNNVKIAEINPLGDDFDPNLHNSVRADVSEGEPNKVLEVLQKGYQMNGRVIRPATVVVSKTSE